MQGIKTSILFVGAKKDIVLLTVGGYVDTTTSRELTKIIQDLINRKNLLIIADMGGVTYISSAGWGVFVGEIKGLRERGGDIKIVQMTPEVYEVFEMLEFNRILNYYDTLEEAIDEYDIIRGIDISVQEKINPDNNPGITGGESVYPASSVLAHSARWKAVPSGSPRLAPDEFPLVEKIKMIVIDHPFGGIRYINKQLKTEKYGSVKTSYFKLWPLLRELNLENKEKRYRFYRSR